MSQKVLVIRTDDMERLRSFFEAFGVVFVEEQHGKGPKHYAAQHGDHVLEIYPEGSKGPGLTYM